MEQKNYLKLLWIAGFIAFAAVSCWATSESLHLLLSTWPTVMCWVVTIGFFIIASIGTKMIVDSLNKNIYLEKRGSRLIGGIFIVIIFWLICSMPTNTHTFFYRTLINDEVTTDISTTRGYLQQIKGNTKNKNIANDKITELENSVYALLGELEAEIMNDANPGFGPKAKEILRRFADLLNIDKIEPLTYTGTTKQDRQKLCDAYRTKILIHLETCSNNIRNRIERPDDDDIESMVKEVSAIDENLAMVKKYINDKTIDLNNPDDMTGDGGVCDKLNDGYNAIKKNYDFVIFSSKADEALYRADTPVTKVKRLISVFDVWKDFLAGKYAGRNFVFWIIISILVDIAAFIFFDLAFRKREDY